MNYRRIFYQLSLLLVVVSVLLAAFGGFAAIQLHLGSDTVDAAVMGTDAEPSQLLMEKPAMLAFLASSAAGLLVGAFMWLLTRGGSGSIGRRESEAT